MTNIKPVKVIVPSYTRKGKKVRGYSRKKLKRSGKNRLEKTKYVMTVVRDTKTGWIVGTKKTRVK
jgi:hypothetical protein